MKKLSFIIISLSFFGQLNAQTPHKDLGIKESEIEYLTLSDGRYDEYHGYKDFERVGSVVIDMKTRKIAYFISRDSILDEGMFELDMTTRFLTADPLAEKYFEMSPYGYCANNPIGNIDIEGKFIFNNASNYPRVAELIKNISAILNNSTILNNLSEVSGMDASIIRQQFSYGVGPEITIEDLQSRSAYDQYFGYTKTEEGELGNIVLDQAMLLNLEDDLKSGILDEHFFLAIITILHEYNHSADIQLHKKRFKDLGQPNENCLGYQFEDKTWNKKFFDKASVIKYFVKNSVDNEKTSKEKDKRNKDFWQLVSTLPVGNYKVEDGKIIPQ